jgi:hypothetical protein
MVAEIPNPTPRRVVALEESKGHHMVRFLIALVFSMLGCFGCKKSESPDFDIDDDHGTDPYCNAIVDWAAEVAVTAVYSDPSERDQIEVGFRPKEEIVDMDGHYGVDGAYVPFVGYDQHELWLVLLLMADQERITISGAIDCKNRSADFVLTLMLDDESDEIETEIVIGDLEGDGGVIDADSGISSDN